MSKFNAAKAKAKAEEIAKLGKTITENADSIDTVYVIDKSQRKSLDKIGKKLDDDKFIDSFSRGIIGMLYALQDRPLTDKDIERIVDMCDRTAQLKYREGMYDAVNVKSIDILIDRLEK